VEISKRHVHGQQQTERIDEDMALASFTHGCASHPRIPADSSTVLTLCASMMADDHAFDS
jgi:hypothetical protein